MTQFQDATSRFKTAVPAHREPPAAGSEEGKENFLRKNVGLERKEKEEKAAREQALSKKRQEAVGCVGVIPFLCC